MGTVGPSTAAVAPAVWLVVAATWVAELFVPFATRGALSTTSPLDAVALQRSGALDGMVGTGAVLGLLALPLAGLVIACLVPARGRAAALARGSVALAGLLAGLVLLHALTDLDTRRMGTGGWLTALGCLAALTGAVVEAGRHLSERTPRGTS